MSLTILNGQGLPIKSDDEAAEEARRIWEPVFNASGGDESLFHNFEQFVQRVNMVLEPLSAAQFEQLIQTNRSASPGPDGICYRAWSKSGAIGGEIL